MWSLENVITAVVMVGFVIMIAMTMFEEESTTLEVEEEEHGTNTYHR